MQQLEESQNARPIGSSQFISGAGIGLLVGVLIGLSLSPVVGTVLGGLTALLAAFLGLTNQEMLGKKDISPEEKERERRIREFRAGSFGLACALGLLIGLFIRTHDLLGLSLLEKFDAWKEIGYSEAEARQLVVYRELGILPEDMTESKSAGAPRPDLTVLYASRLETCRDLAPEKYQDAAEVLNAWTLRRRGRWNEVALLIREHIPEEKQKSVVDSVWKLTCDFER